MLYERCLLFPLVQRASGIIQWNKWEKAAKVKHPIV